MNAVIILLCPGVIILTEIFSKHLTVLLFYYILYLVMLYCYSLVALSIW